MASATDEKFRIAPIYYTYTIILYLSFFIYNLMKTVEQTEVLMYKQMIYKLLWLYGVYTYGLDNSK